jgi:hypothetical protein
MSNDITVELEGISHDMGYYNGIYLEGQKATIKTLSKDRRCPSRK